LIIYRRSTRIRDQWKVFLWVSICLHWFRKDDLEQHSSLYWRPTGLALCMHEMLGSKVDSLRYGISLWTKAPLFIRHLSYCIFRLTKLNSPILKVSIISNLEHICFSRGPWWEASTSQTHLKQAQSDRRVTMSSFLIRLLWVNGKAKLVLTVKGRNLNCVN